MCEYYNFSLRQCNKYVQQGKFVKDYIDKFDTYDYKYQMILSIIIPMLLAIKINDIMEYSQIINGKGKQDFVNCIFNNLYVKKVIRNIIKDKYSENSDDLDNEVIISLYEILFCYNQNNENNMWIQIFDYNPQIICELLTLASKKINYNTKELVVE